MDINFDRACNDVNNVILLLQMCFVACMNASSNSIGDNANFISAIANYNDVVDVSANDAAPVLMLILLDQIILMWSKCYYC